MITITARINVSESGGTINSLTSNLSGNNISANINSVLGKKRVSVGNPFILNSSKLGSGATFKGNVPYFLGRQVSDNYGVFPQSYTINLSGSGIKQFVIAFDTENGAFPESILVDGETVYDDDPIWEINVSDANTHTITISKWNKPNSPLIITAIYADINIDIDKNNLLSFNTDILNRGDIKYPSYGIISNSANLDVADLDEHILDLIRQRVLHSKISVEVWLNDSDSNSQEPICVMQTRELTYDNDNRKVQISLKDNLEEWQEIAVPAIYYDPVDGEPLDGKRLYLDLSKATPSKYNMLTFDELDGKTKGKIAETTFEYPVLDADTLWNEWQKFCEICKLYIYVDYRGKTVCKYGGDD